MLSVSSGMIFCGRQASAGVTGNRDMTANGPDIISPCRVGRNSVLLQVVRSQMQVQCRAYYLSNTIEKK